MVHDSSLIKLSKFCVFSKLWTISPNPVYAVMENLPDLIAFLGHKGCCTKNGRFIFSLLYILADEHHILTLFCLSLIFWGGTPFNWNQHNKSTDFTNVEPSVSKLSWVCVCVHLRVHDKTMNKAVLMTGAIFQHKRQTNNMNQIRQHMVWHTKKKLYGLS